MPDSANKNDPKIDRMEWAKALLKKAEGAYARSVNSRDHFDYKDSMREAVVSIVYSTELLCFLLTMDDKQRLPRPGWLQERVEAIPRQSIDEKHANRFTTIANYLYNASRLTLEWIEQSTSE